MKQIEQFKLGAVWEDSRAQLNALVDVANAFLRMRGDGLVLVNHSSNGATVGLSMDMVRARIGRPSPVKYAKVTALYNWQGVAWTAYDTAAGTQGFIAFVDANPCEWGGDPRYVNTDVTLRLKTSDDPLSSFVGFMDIAVSDVVGYVRSNCTEEVLGDSVYTYDGYVLADAGVHGAYYNLGYPDTANTYDLTDIFGGLTSMSAVGNVKIDRSGRIVAWKDTIGGAWQWHYDQFP